jgi:hypothetical protein
MRAKSPFMILERSQTSGEGKSKIALSPRERVNLAVSCPTFPEHFDVPESRTVI